MIYKYIPEIEQVFLGSTAIGRIFNGSDLVFGKEDPYSGIYIRFADPDVKYIIVNDYGDTTIGEITYTQAAEVTSFYGGVDPSDNVLDLSWSINSPMPFYNNGNVNSFNEFTYFTGVTSIANSTFESCYNMTSIKIPNSVTAIGKGAFGGCSSLVNIEIPSNVTYIGSFAFTDCVSLTSVTIPNSVTDIGYRAFSYCDALESLSIGNSVRNIYNGAFAYCGSLTGSLTLPNSLTYVGEEAFYFCYNLASVTIPNSVTTINDRTFFNCSNLQSVTLSNSLTYIGTNAFYHCAIESITLPETLTHIGDGAFDTCQSLTSITIPASVTEIGDGAFYECEDLESITCNATTPPTLGPHVDSFNHTNECPIFVPATKVAAYKAAEGWSDYASRIQAIPTNISFADNDVKTILVNKYGSNGQITDAQAAAVTTFMSGTNKTNNPFYENANIDTFNEFRYFTGITAIGNSTFGFCSFMTSITIPNSVTSIGTFVFENCESLTSVSIPASVTSIGEGAFYGCMGLDSITCNATTPPTLGFEVFTNTNNCPIYVPAASVDAYKAATRWSSYASRIRAKS